ncbi:zinc finger CCCH domain-containing protein 3 isoform X2 [Rhodnius prolixus]
MSTDSFLKIAGSNEVAVPAFVDLAHAKRENTYCSTTIHVNPLCAPNKILVNKEKLSKGTRNNVPLQAISERIYYNPKFLTKTADICVKPCNETSKFHVGPMKFESNIHINRNYLPTQNDANAAASYFREQSRGIHVNPKFLNNQNQFNQSEKFSDNKLSTNPASIVPVDIPSIKHISPVKRKELKNIVTLQNKSCGDRSVIKSKYKFVKNSSIQSKIENNSSSLCYKTKYSLKRLSIRKDTGKVCNKIDEMSKIFNSKSKLGRLSSEFKKLSRTKLVRKSMLQSIILARRCSRNNLYKRSLSDLSFYKKIPLRKKTRNIIYFPKLNPEMTKQRTNNSINNNNTSFKKLGKMKIIRKSLLKAQIESRNQVRKHYLVEYRTSQNRKNYNISISSRKYIAKQRDLLRWRKKKQLYNLVLTKSKKNSQTPSLKSFKKNNHPCPFYNRFGRCKGKEKGTCSKLHDVKYISICRKLLQGECNTKDCLLSHDIRPGKMPTCHHYLAGLCTRPNCPFLHIKVNPKAPICMSFLQGFCPDVFNCLKRHEFICPIYAEKGSCPRGKSCTYPHRSPVVRSKLLKDDQKPLIHRKDILVNPTCESKFKQGVSSTTKTSLECDSKNVETSPEKVKNIKKCKKKFVKEPFTRYFAVPSTKEEVRDDESKSKEPNELSNNVVNDLR